MEYIRKDYEPKTKISDRSPVEFTDNATMCANGCSNLETINVSDGYFY